MSTHSPAAAKFTRTMRVGGFGNHCKVVSIPVHSWFNLKRANIPLICLGALCLSGMMVASGQPVRWDAVSKKHTAIPGQTETMFDFRLTNNSPAEVVITGVSSSCACAIPILSSRPLKIPAGEAGLVQLRMNFKGKHGTVTKTVLVQASTGPTVLTATVTIPEAANSAQRERNLALAQADRQSVFQNDCASCHAEPAKGKLGAPLYAAACGICHDAEHRASMVPDLRTLNHPGTEDYWRGIVAHGKPGTLMPAFSQTEGGPLDEAQIKSLIDFLSQSFAPTTADQPPNR